MARVSKLFAEGSLTSLVLTRSLVKTEMISRFLFGTSCSLLQLHTLSLKNGEFP